MINQQSSEIASSKTYNRRSTKHGVTHLEESSPVQQNQSTTAKASTVNAEAF